MSPRRAFGSCGRIPFKERHNGRLVRYDVATDTHPRTPEGHCIECAPGEVGESSTVTLTRDDDDGEFGLGELLQFDRLFVRRDDDGRSWLWLSAKITGSNADQTFYTLRSLTIAPESLPALDQPEEPLGVFDP